MCLLKHDIHPELKPFNKTKVRWRLFLKAGNQLQALYNDYNYTKYWNKLKHSKRSEIRDWGFHVFVTREEARMYKQNYHSERYVVLRKVLVKKFKLSGSNSSLRYLCNEIWREIKIIDY